MDMTHKPALLALVLAILTSAAVVAQGEFVFMCLQFFWVNV